MIICLCMNASFFSDTVEKKAYALYDFRLKKDNVSILWFKKDSYIVY